MPIVLDARGKSAGRDVFLNVAKAVWRELEHTQ